MVHKLVFVKNEKVTLDITLYRSDVDFLQIKELVNMDRTKLTIEKDDKHKNIIVVSE
ncbi:hypothetical protein ACFSTH_00970 [Paenibacillus yanchengensis]|uniref:Bacillus phage SPbeta YonK domain-containing protein n=1 Tax=Paenibacillus yanchengensis TaxID=2035833 RepID=A0ABW4YFS5_9BACL